MTVSKVSSREATKSEVAAYCKKYIKIRFRHFVREVYAPRALNGVAHRYYTTSKTTVNDDGRAIVAGGLFKGEELTGTHYTLDNHTWIGDIRFVSLPSSFKEAHQELAQLKKRTEGEDVLREMMEYDGGYYLR